MKDKISSHIRMLTKWLDSCGFDQKPLLILASLMLVLCVAVVAPIAFSSYRDSVNAIKAERKDAEEAGYLAGMNGVPASDAPLRYREEWTVGWDEAELEKKNEEERRQAALRKEQAQLEQARVAALAVLQRQQQLMPSQYLWMAGESKLKEIGFYESIQYKDDMQGITEFAHENRDSLDDELVRKFMDGWLYKIERDKYRAISHFLRQRGVTHEQQWLELRDLAARYGWPKPN